MLTKALSGAWDKFNLSEISLTGSLANLTLTIITQGPFVLSKAVVKYPQRSHLNLIKHIYFGKTGYIPNCFKGIAESSGKEMFKGLYKIHILTQSPAKAKAILARSPEQIQSIKILEAFLAGIFAGTADALASQGPDRIVNLATTREAGENGLIKHFQQFKGRPTALFHDVFLRGLDKYCYKQITTYVLFYTYKTLADDYAKKNNINLKKGWNEVKSSLIFGITATILTTPFDYLNTLKKMSTLAENAAKSSETVLKSNRSLFRPVPYLALLKLLGSTKNALLFYLFQDNPNYAKAK